MMMGGFITFDKLNENQDSLRFTGQSCYKLVFKNPCFVIIISLNNISPKSKEMGVLMFRLEKYI